MLERNVKIEEHDYHGKVYYAKKATKIKTAVRLFCGECMGMCRTERDAAYPQEDVKDCTDRMCPLFEWRMGTNPYRAKRDPRIAAEFGARMRKIRARKSPELKIEGQGIGE